MITEKTTEIVFAHGYWDIDSLILSLQHAQRDGAKFVTVERKRNKVSKRTVAVLKTTDKNLNI